MTLIGNCLYLQYKGCFVDQLSTLEVGYKQLLSTLTPNAGGTNSPFLKQLYPGGRNDCF